MKPVRTLPSEVCSLVRSGVVIPTPSQAVVELVLNSIDAGATSITVRVDLQIFKIQVVDNGCGITSKDLEEIGNRSVTNKCYDLDEFYCNLKYHGYRGESLASLREMCGLLEIVTRPSDSNITYSKLFVHGKEGNVKISDLKRPAYGTTVTITDFMFNMPLRRERMKEAVELEAMRSYIECIALAHPEISLSLRNDVKGRVIIEKHRSSDLLNAFEHLFGHNLARMLAAINFSTEKFKISGYIGKEAYRHNDLQFIYVNRQSIIKTKLHKLIAALLSKSSIIRTNGPWKNKPIPKDVLVERWLTFSSLEKQKKFAVFVINITCARKEYEMCWDAKKPLIYFKDWEGITACVSSAVQEFLTLENLVEEDDIEHEVTENEIRISTSSLQGKSQPPHTSYSWENTLDHQMNFEVETWNIQGAVHGISAKRPKENKKYLTTGVCEEGINQKTDPVNEIQRQFLTPDTINSNKELQNEQESVAPVVKFLKKYEPPSAARLQITKGAYRLKQKEEEEKRKKIASMLDNFKLSKKPKLTNNKNYQNFQKSKLICEKSLNKGKTKDQTSLKPKIKEHKNLKKLLYNRVSTPFISNSSETLSPKTGKQDELQHSIEPHDQIDVNSSRKRKKKIVNTEQVVESEDISNYFSFSPSSNDDTKINATLCSSLDIFSFTTEQIPSCRNDDSNWITDWSNSEKPCSLSLINERKVQVQDSFHQSCTKVVNSCKYPSYWDMKRSNAFSNHENVFDLKHDSWNSSSFDMKEFHGNENSFKSHVTKNCTNLSLSKTLVVSIPTPQPRRIPVPSATSSALMDKFHFSNKYLKRNRIHLADTCVSPNPLVPFVSVQESPSHENHNSDEIKELFTHDVDNCRAAGCSWSGQDSLKFIPSSLVNSNVDELPMHTECSRNLSDAEITVPYFAPKNKTEDGVGEHLKTIKLADVSYLKKIRNFNNMFESFKKHVTPNNFPESRSPYFTFKNNTIHPKELMKLNNFDMENRKNESGRNFRQNDEQKGGSDETLSMFGVPKTSQQVEFFRDLDNSMDEGIKGCPSVNVLSSECSSLIKHKSCIRELEDATCASTSVTSSLRASDFEPSTSTHLDLDENFSYSKNVAKRRQLKQNTSEMVRNDEESSLFVNKSTEQVSKEGRPFNSDNCVTSKCENINAHHQTVLPNEEQCQKETETSLDEVMDKDWLQVRNFEGKLFYFHASSGFTTYDVPFIAKDANLCSMSKRCQFLPKGMSPLLAMSTVFHSTSEQQSDTNISADAPNWIINSSGMDDLKTVKWRNKPDIVNNNISDVLNTARAILDKKTLSSNTTIPDLSYISAKISSLSFQQKFDKRIFSKIQVIGQLDNKFIVTLCSLDKNSNPHILGIFDQHAVHERIRLETLMRAYSSNEDEWSFTATDLDEPIVLTVSSKESHIMSNYQNKFQKLGLHFVLMDKDNAKIHKIPTCFYTRFVRERSSQWLERILYILIQDVVQLLIKTGGHDSVPEVFKDVINSEACKGAIKFGDLLSVIQCECLLSELSKCDLPFYCAHGRPSFMPVFDLRQFEEDRRKYVQEN